MKFNYLCYNTNNTILRKAVAKTVVVSSIEFNLKLLYCSTQMENDL